MGMRKEIEQAQVGLQEEKRLAEQERVRVKEKREEREIFFKEKAYDVMHLYLEDLQQSGAIEALEELNKEMGLNSEIEVEAIVSAPIISYLNGVDIEENKLVYFFQCEKEKGEWRVEINRQERHVHPKRSDLEKYREGLASGEHCYARLNWGKWYKGVWHTSGPSDSNPEGSSWTTKEERFLQFAFCVSGQPPGQFIRLIDETCGEHGEYKYFTDREGCRKEDELFSFPREQWGNKELLRRRVAQAYVYLEDVARSCSYEGETLHYNRDLDKVDAPEKRESTQPETSLGTFLGRSLRKLLGR